MTGSFGLPGGHAKGGFGKSARFYSRTKPAVSGKTPDDAFAPSGVANH
jgi:hypothetical protein